MFICKMALGTDSGFIHQFTNQRRCKVKKRMFITVALFLCGCLLVAADSTGGNLPVIGFLEKTETDLFHRQINGGAQKACQKLKSERKIKDYIFLNGNSDVSTQIAQAEDLITQKVDVIVMAPVDNDGCAPIVDMCNKAGIPIVILNSKTSNRNYTAYVGADDVVSGEMLAQHVMDLIGGKGHIYILQGVMGNSGQILRDQGIDKVLAKYPNAKVMYRITADWKREKAMEFTEGWLLQDPDIKAILCHNDDMALGAASACVAAGRKKGIVVMGIDALDDAVQAIREGWLDATLLQDGVAQSSAAVDVAYKIVTKKPYSKNTIIDFVLITPQNVNEKFPK